MAPILSLIHKTLKKPRQNDMEWLLPQSDPVTLGPLSCFTLPTACQVGTCGVPQTWTTAFIGGWRKNLLQVGEYRENPVDEMAPHGQWGGRSAQRGQKQDTEERFKRNLGPREQWILANKQSLGWAVRKTPWTDGLECNGIWWTVNWDYRAGDTCVCRFLFSECCIRLQYYFITL